MYDIILFVSCSRLFVFIVLMYLDFIDQKASMQEEISVLKSSLQKVTDAFKSLEMVIQTFISSE